MAQMIFAGLGDVHAAPTPGAIGIREKIYITPLIGGISEALWKKIYNETNEYHPMFGKDGSEVYTDSDRWIIVRRIGNQEIRIANITAIG